MPLPYAMLDSNADLIALGVSHEYVLPNAGYSGKFNTNHPTIAGTYRDNAADNNSFSLLKHIDGKATSAFPYSLSDSLSVISSVSLASMRFFKSLSIRASLTQALEAVVVSINIVSFNLTTDTVTVEFDKAVPLLIYIRELNVSGTETGQMTTAAQGIGGGFGLTKTINIPKQSGKYRLIVPTGKNAYSIDYDGLTPTTAILSYVPATNVALKNEYPQGIVAGKRDFAESIYPLADGDGFDSATVLATPTWDSATNKQLFRDTIANKNSIDASKTFLNALVARGASAYISTNTIPSYYTNLAVTSSQEVLNTGGITAYKAVYDEYTPFATAFPTYPSSTNGTLLAGLKDDFVALVSSDNQATGYQNAGNEIEAQIVATETTGGLPEGKSAYSFSGTFTNTEFGNAALHIYNAGAVSAYQRMMDEGLTDGFDFRDLTNQTLALTASTVRTQYDALKDDFRLELQAEGKKIGLRYYLEQIRTQYGFTYDNTNTGNLNDAAYVTYMEGLRATSLTQVANSGSIAAYEDIYDTIVTNFGFSYLPNRTTAQLAALKTSALTAVNSWGMVSGFQELYDLGAASYFDEQTNYLSIKAPSQVVRVAYLNTLATSMRNLKNDFYTRAYEWGAIFTYKDRLYPYAIPFGFNYSNTQQLASYYADLEDDYIAALQQGFGGAAILSQTVTYNNGLVGINVVLNRPAKFSAWLSKNGDTVSNVVNSLIPATTHILSIPMSQSQYAQLLDIELEVVNV